MPEWIRNKRMNWPDGSKQRALKGKSALEALAAITKRKEEPRVAPKEIPLEQLSDEDLALAVAGRLIKEMHRLGGRRARREAGREPNP